ETDPQFNAWDKDYADLTNTPTIPTVPANVGAFTNDAGYLTEFNETDPQFNAWNKSTGILISESQISDLDHFTNADETDPVFTAWDKTTGISITESQISNLQSYLTSETDPSVAANFDFTDAATGDLLQFNGTKWVKVTPDYISDYTVIEADVTAHEAALTVSESQISDLGNYIETETQNLADVITLNNSANAQIKNVTNPTDAQDAATKAYVDVLLDKILQLQAEVGAKDIEGNTYNAVKIGNQVWMAENLKTTKYNDGTAIPNVTNNATWGALTTSAYADYNNTPSNSTTYGKLYNYYAVVDARKICPTGWHVPTNTEFSTLIDYLGGTSVAGGKLKETGTTHWTTPNSGATNETGFTALPGGCRSDGSFYDIGKEGNWWSATGLFNPSFAYDFLMIYNGSSVSKTYSHKSLGQSVRCVRDN
ncbi:MAG: fibrobacter succinogenes major paralogous domain-containing protein, partial [Bacteroidales bacterium]|nr:fibrobacter succinogenes major paralogous domain-containing protein [Bacteroidales bacterium]